MHRKFDVLRWGQVLNGGDVFIKHKLEKKTFHMTVGIEIHEALIELLLAADCLVLSSFRV